MTYKFRHITFMALTAVTALALMACDSDNYQEAVYRSGGIDFDIYALRGVSGTRAGAPGDITSVRLQTPAEAVGNAGVGVFGFYTGRDKYDHLIHKPNFMHNVQVKYVPATVVGGVTVTVPARWDYEPLMYWPNEYEGDYGTGVTHGDRLSFFAYAPYVEVDRATGFVDETATAINGTTAAKSGIVGMTDRNHVGNPLIHYVVGADPAEAVDLCWATAGPSWSYVDASDATVSRVEGMPLLDLTRMKSFTNKVNLTFRHALAKLNIQIDGSVNEVDGQGVDAQDSYTHVYLRRVTLTGFALRGTLDLCNATASKARWLTFGGGSVIQPETIVLNDGRAEGHEGEPGGASSGEENQLLNPQLIQHDEYVSQGVTGALQNLFAGTSASTAQYVIPDGSPLGIAIDYDIETADSKLIGQTLSDGSTLGKSLSCRVSSSNITTLESGKQYTLKIHLGLTSVKFDLAPVVNW